MSAIQIIGRADGPTSIFVAGKISGAGLLWFGVGIAIAIVAVIIVWKIHKKKKER